MQDRVTTLGSGVDSNVRRIEREYDVRGLSARVTSYSSATVGAGTIRNEIERTYDDFGHLDTEYQDHDSAVNTGSSPKVQYDYSTGSAGHTRLTKMTYPNGRLLHVGYDSGADDEINRVSWLADDNGSGSAGTHLVEYCRSRFRTGPFSRTEEGHLDGCGMRSDQRFGEVSRGMGVWACWQSNRAAS